MATLNKVVKKTSLPQAIIDGDYDSDLRDIVRACFQRRRVLFPNSLTGTLSMKLEQMYPAPTSAPTKGKTDPSDEALAELRRKLTGDYDADDEVDATEAGVVLADVNGHKYFPLSGPIQPVPKGMRVGSVAGVFKYKSRWRFWARDLELHYFTYPSHMTPAAISGCRLGVRVVNDRSVSCVILDRPSSTRGQYYDAWENGTLIHLHYSVLEKANLIRLPN